MKIISTINPTPQNIQEVVEVVCHVTGVSQHQLYSKSRYREYVAARNMCYSIMRLGLGMTLTSIANEFDKHHDTILYAVKINQRDLEMSGSYRSRFEHILLRLGVGFTEQISHGDTIKLIRENMFRRESIVID